MDKELLFMDEQRKWFLEMESIPGEDAVKIVEMTQKYLIYYIKLVGKVAGKFENLVKQSTMGKILPNNIA